MFHVSQSTSYMYLGQIYPDYDPDQVLTQDRIFLIQITNVIQIIVLRVNGVTMSNLKQFFIIKSK